MKWNIDRSSLDDKLRDFLEWMDALKKDTVHRVGQCYQKFVMTLYILTIMQITGKATKEQAVQITD